MIAILILLWVVISIAASVTYLCHAHSTQKRREQSDKAKARIIGIEVWRDRRGAQARHRY
jgi:hypothetical protein